MHYILITTLLLFSHITAADRISEPLDQLINKYPVQHNESAEILEKRIITELDNDGKHTTKVYVAIRINNENAIDDYSQMNIAYNDYFDELTLDFANILTTQQELVGVKSDAVQIKSDSSENFYVDTKSLAFSLPLTYPGSVIEFQYTRKQLRPRIEGELFHSGSFYHWERKANPQNYRADFVHYSSYTLYAPSSTPIYYYTSKSHPIDYQKTNLNKRIQHHWSTKAIKPFIAQNYIPTSVEITPYIDISTIKQWQGIRQWAQQLIEPTIQSTPEIKAIANRIRKQSSDQLSQIKFVFHYMQENIRYVFAHVGRGGYKPHTTGEVLSNGYGDCKDQTVLTIALLRELGIDAYPALVSTTGKTAPNAKIPQIAFDHMITYIPQQKDIQETWIDTVGGNFLFPGLSNTVHKQKALPITSNTNALVTIDNLYNKPNNIALSLDINAPEKSQLTVNFRLQLEGEIESTLRNWLRYSKSQETAIRNAFNSLYTKARVENIKVHNFDNALKEVVVTGELLFEHKNEQDQPSFGFAANISQLANVFSLIPKLDLPQDRLYDVELRDDYMISVNAQMEKPSGYLLQESSNKTVVDNNKVFSYEHNIDDKLDKVTINQQLVLHSINTPLSEYTYIYDNLKRIDEKYWIVNLVYNESITEIKALSNSHSKDKKAEEFTQLIQLLLDNGKYTEALEQTKKGLEKYPKNGNITYLQGLAYAYLDNSELAEVAFSKAEELGYEI